MKYCSKYHANPDDAVFCQECGENITSIKQDHKDCPQCGIKNPLEAKFCFQCGCKLYPEKICHNGHECIDLGLSVKWATCNVGANSPSDYGDYFAWGETKAKRSFYKKNCETYIESNLFSGLFGNNDKSIPKKEITCSIEGNPSFDVATLLWGSMWRMPTKNEVEELINNCTWEWCKNGNTMGYRIVGTNGNSIFLPAAGVYVDDSLDGCNRHCCYWTSTPKENSLTKAYFLTFYSSIFRISCWWRCIGRNVRPVSM